MSPVADGIPPDQVVTVPGDIAATLTVTARLEGHGLLVSLKTEGDFAAEAVDRRFYSIAELPPADLDPAQFWATILGGISGLLGASDDDG